MKVGATSVVRKRGQPPIVFPTDKSGAGHCDEVFTAGDTYKTTSCGSDVALLVLPLHCVRTSGCLERRHHFSPPFLGKAAALSHLRENRLYILVVTQSRRARNTTQQSIRYLLILGHF